MVGRILRALFYHYIKQKAKQTLKRPDNSSHTMSSQKDLTTEPRGTTIATSSTGTSEKITMETQIEPVIQVREWALEKIQLLHDADRHKNAKALAAEFEEWINIPDGTDELNYLCLEDQDWTEDQEIDIR